MMTETPLTNIIYVEDSDDEVFLARMVFRREKLDLDLVHYDQFDTFESDVVEHKIADLDRALLVLDLNLKLCNGNEAMHRLRRLEATRNMIMGICTGSEDPADRRDADSAGADFFVSKPLNIRSLQRICEGVEQLSLIRASDGRYQVLRAS